MTSFWADLASQLRSTTEYRRLHAAVVTARDHPPPGAEPDPRRATVERAPLVLLAWLAELLRADTRRPLLLLVPRESEAGVVVEAARLLLSPPPSSDGGEVPIAFPAPALTPYQETRASLSVRTAEVLALDGLFARSRPAVVCTPRALFQRLPSRAAFERLATTLRAGQRLDLDQLVRALAAAGYRRTDLVAEVGTFAVRGGVVDLFPPGDGLPLRLDLFGDTLEELRRFDPVSQRSQRATGQARVLPMGLFASGAERAQALARRLLELGGADSGIETAERVEALSRGETFPGWENYLPLVEETETLADLLPGALVVLAEEATLREELRHHVALLQTEYAARREQMRLAVPPELLGTEEAAACSVLDRAAVVSGAPPGSRSAVTIDFACTLTDQLARQLPRFPREVETARARGDRLVLVAPAAHHDRLNDYLDGALGERASLRQTVTLVDGELERGLRLPARSLVLFGEGQLFPRRPAVARSRLSPFLASMRDLKVGDYVVHEDHGIGQFAGMRALPAEGQRSAPAPTVPDAPPGAVPVVEVLEIVYADGRTLLLPPHRIDQVQKYSGLEGVAPRLDQLGGTSWNRKKGRVRRGLRKLATDLLRLYAERALAQAPRMRADNDLQAQFEAAFEFEETEDQSEAAATIKADLEQERPMDRLLCGDVGFGKTEVAMRAAMKTVLSGHQVAVLAPTTILADQHLETMRRRFAGFPVEIEMISRFRSPKEVKQILRRLAEGRVDVLVGTHRLLSHDIDLPRLGLLVVDEEQRFGVAQKERMKELRRNVHVLALSATPVPRTLQLSLAGVRDLSVIETPPKDRLAVETCIVGFSSDLVKEAIEFELERGGQVYYVYNRVEDIEEIGTFLRELLPQLRITVGHGQMDERELSRRMHAFVRGEYDLLLATTIIENGIDIPRVNTMIVHSAERFGLAQLYQLRGRVGRSDQLAFCYLMVPGDRVLPEHARKRLEAIQEFTDLGAGFRIAARDLEIRGAGDLLGAEQSGHIAEIGIETYMKMLEETIRELRGEPAEAPPAVQLDLPVPLSIPPRYIDDASLRMDVYRRLATLSDDASVVLLELRDRFGPPPEEVQNLVRMAALKRFAEELRVQSISHQGRRLQIHLRRDARVDVDSLIRFVGERGNASFSPGGVLALDGVPASESLEVARRVLEAIVPPLRPERVAS